MYILNKFFCLEKKLQLISCVEPNSHKGNQGGVYSVSGTYPNRGNQGHSFPISLLPFMRSIPFTLREPNAPRVLTSVNQGLILFNILLLFPIRI